MVLPITNPTKSFWIEAAESGLDRNHRSTAELPEEVDVVIIGSGYAGASCAYWTHKFTVDKCPSMLMLEARDICGAATGRNGGQLRPHYYSRFTPWSGRFGPETAHALIKHEAAHLDVFPKLVKEEGIADEVCFKLVETSDVIMHEEAMNRLRNEFETMKAAFGEDDELVKSCRLVDDPKEAQRLTQIKGCVGAVLHPSGQIWPYKFVHALLRIVMQTGHLNLQANTPALKVSKEGALYVVKTARGSVRAKSVVHATNRWAGHLLPELEGLITPGRGTLGAVKAPEGYLKRSGAQIWNDTISNYHLQLPPPHNQLIIGGMRPITTHVPERMANDREDIQFPGGPEYAERWAADDIVGWHGKSELAREAHDGGVWTGVWGNTADAFPFVGQLPRQPGNFVAAAFNGHGMPRILLTTAHLAPLVLDHLGIPHKTPESLEGAPPLPSPFVITQERVDELRKVDMKAWQADRDKAALRGAEMDVCQRYKPLTEMGMLQDIKSMVLAKL